MPGLGIFHQRIVAAGFMRIEDVISREELRCNHAILLDRIGTQFTTIILFDRT
jgi:hypothetical protein